MQSTDITPSAPTQAEPQAVQPVQETHLPMASNWTQALFAPLETPVAPDTTTLPAETPASVEAATEATPPPDAPEQPPVETPPVQEAPEEVTPKTDEEKALYERVSAELKSQYPTMDETILKRWTDDKFLAKMSLAEKGKQISQLLKRVTKKEPAARIVTDFERSLESPPEPQSKPPVAEQPPVAQPPAVQAVNRRIPSHLNWEKASDVFNSEANLWGRFHSDSVTPEEQEEIGQKLGEVRDKQIQLSLEKILPQLALVAEEKALRMVQAQLGDVLPVMRQTAAQKEAEASHAFAVQELEKAGHEGIREMVKPLSDAPLIWDGKEYDDTPLNRVFAQFPHILKINVTHDANGKPYPRKTAEQLTRIKRYEAADELWPMIAAQQAKPEPPQPSGTPQPDRAAVGQAYQAGLAAAKQGDADRARQALNAGSGASMVPGTPAEHTLMDDYRASGAINLNSIFRK